MISDVHYNLQTLPVADAAMRRAIDVTNDMKVPLVVCGDLHDTKANLRGECVNALLAVFSSLNTDAYILRGNHDSVNERSEDSSLSFLDREALREDGEVVCRTVVNRPNFFNKLGAIDGKSIHLIPYQHDPNAFRAYVKKIDKGSTIIVHQGLTGTAMGDYIQDKSAINPEDVAGFRVISGHYHTRQTRQLPGGGVWNYVGNPYTLSYGEANDPAKGYQILMSDGSLRFVPTNLRKHVVVEINYDLSPTNHPKLPAYAPGDIVWVKAFGRGETVRQLSKATVAQDLGLLWDFRLDIIPTDSPAQVTRAQQDLSGGSLLDSLIDGLPDSSDERKTRLKSLWKDMV